MTQNAQDLFDKLKQANRLPSPPGVALRVLELAQDEEASVRDVADVICTDPVLAAKILKLVNSPIAGVAKQVSSLPQAISLLGLRSVKMVALSFSLIGMGAESVSCDFEMSRFWSRSLARAVAARTITRTCRTCDPEEAFIAGLLSDFGQLVMATQFPERYGAVLEDARNSADLLQDIEQRVIGATRTEITCKLLELWEFPPTICRAIGAFRGLDDPSEALPLIAALLAADWAADLICAEQSRRCQDPNRLATLVGKLYGWDGQEWSGLFDQIGKQWNEYGSILSVETGQFKSFADIQVEAQERIAEMTLAVHIENKRTNREQNDLLKRANTDMLTGLSNRAAFDERLRHELRRAERKGQPMALAMIDLDRFKRVNDTRGHLAGDSVLKAVAVAIKESVRQVDFPARFGGEEFVVVAPDCDLTDASAFGDRIRLAIEALCVSFEGLPIRITASVGVVVLKDARTCRAPDDLIRTADLLLYRAKQAGRNTVKVASMRNPTPSPEVTTSAPA